MGTCLREHRGKPSDASDEVQRESSPVADQHGDQRTASLVPVTNLYRRLNGLFLVSMPSFRLLSN